MLVRTPSARDPIFTASIALALVAAATILGAYYFQYVLGLAPCPLCLEERVAYYVVIPLAVLVVAGALVRAPRGILGAGLVVIIVALVANVGLGAYHAGVEWKFWPGPLDCSAPPEALGQASDLLKELNSVHVVRCDAAAWRFLGVSLAGYNVLISLALAGIAGWALWVSRRT